MRLLEKVGLAMVVLALAVPTLARADAAAGKAIYDKKCANCHGADGKGDAKMEAKLKAKTTLAEIGGKSDADMMKLLQEGKKPMPGYAKSLSQAELDDVWAYTKSLIGK
ncbi:MAG: cytochrome c [bacterium]